VAEYAAYGGKALGATRCQRYSEAGHPASAARLAAACRVRRRNGRRLKSGPVSADNAQPTCARWNRAADQPEAYRRTKPAPAAAKALTSGFTAES